MNPLPARRNYAPHKNGRVPAWGENPWENARAEQSGTGQCVNTDPFLDRVNLAMEGSGPMAILPEADSSATPPLDVLFSERMSRADGCPTTCGNYALPTAVRDTPTGFLADYVCESCGHTWVTGWGEC